MNKQDKIKLLRMLKNLTGELSHEQENEFINKVNLEKINLLNKVKQQFSNHTEVASFPKINFAHAHWSGMQIKDKIATGGIGEVYLAFDSVLNRDVAVKFLSSQSSQYISPKSFIEEARRVAKIRHPNVMAIFGAQIDQNIAGFWSEFLIGKTLAEYEIKSLDFNAKLRIAIQLADAVKATHKNHVVHADIKPQNVMIEQSRGAVLMDFGAGHDLKAESNLTISAYTPLAMAPELFDQYRATRASDIYSLGVVYYFIFNEGTYPYNPKSMTELIALLKQPINIEKINNIPRTLNNLIRQMLSREKNKRPSAHQVLYELIALKKRPLRRLKKIAVSSIIMMLTVVLILSFLSFQQLRKEQKKTTQSLKETSEINSLMYDLLSTVSPTRHGKDVLMIDILNGLINNTKASLNLNDTLKAKTLTTLATSKFNLGFQDEGLDLLDQILSNDQLLPEVKAHILVRKGLLLDQYLEISIQQKTQEIEKIITTVKQLINLEQNNDAELRANLTFLRAIIEKENNNFDAARVSMISALSYWKSLAESKKAGLQQFKITNQIANLLNDQGKFDQAVQYYQSALKLAEKYADNNVNSNIITAKTNLATSLAQMGQAKTSVKVLETLQNQSSQFFGVKHPKHLKITINLISNLNQLEKFQKALEIENQYLPIFNSLENSNNSYYYLYFQSTMAVTKMGLGFYETAEDIYLKIIDKATKLMGEGHVFTLSTVFNLAELYNKQNYFEKTLDLLDQYLSVSEEVLGTKHQVTLEMLEAKAWAFYLSNQITKARQMIKVVIEYKIQVYGSDNPFTLQAKQKLDAMEKPVQL